MFNIKKNKYNLNNLEYSNNVLACKVGIFLLIVLRLVVAYNFFSLRIGVNLLDKHVIWGVINMILTLLFLCIIFMNKKNMKLIIKINIIIFVFIVLIDIKNYPYMIQYFSWFSVNLTTLLISIYYLLLLNSVINNKILKNDDIIYNMPLILHNLIWIIIIIISYMRIL